MTKNLKNFNQISISSYLTYICILYYMYLVFLFRWSNLKIDQYRNIRTRNTMFVSFSVSCIIFIALRRGRRGFHVSGCRRSERRIRQLQQTRPSGGLQKVLHMPWGHRQRIRLSDRHRFQDWWFRWQWRLRRSRGCSRMVSTFLINIRFCIRSFSCAGMNKLRERLKSFEKNRQKRLQQIFRIWKEIEF